MNHREQFCRLLQNNTQSARMSLTAVKYDGMLLDLVKNQTPQICYEAIKQNYLAVQFMNIRSPISLNLYILAIKSNYNALKYINPEYSKYDKLCAIAIQVNPYSIKYIPPEKQTKEICLAIVKKKASSIKYIKNKEIYIDMFTLAIDIDPKVVKYLRHALCKNRDNFANIFIHAVKKGASLEYVDEFNMKKLGKDKYRSVCVEALNINTNNAKYVKNTYISENPILKSIKVRDHIAQNEITFRADDIISAIKKTFNNISDKRLSNNKYGVYYTVMGDSCVNIFSYNKKNTKFSLWKIFRKTETERILLKTYTYVYF